VVDFGLREVAGSAHRIAGVSNRNVKRLTLVVGALFLPAVASAHLIVDVGVAVRAPAYAAKSSTLVYSVDVTDYAYDAAYGIVVYDTLGSGVKFVSASGSGWNCSASGSNVTCSAETLTSGVSTITIQATAPAAIGPVANNAMVTSLGSLDPFAGNDTASGSTLLYDPGVCSSAAPSLNSPPEATTLAAGSVHLTWTPVPGAAQYRVWAAVEGAAASPLAETSSTSLSIETEKGITEWWVDALFDGCPPASSAHRHFQSQGHAFRMSVSDFAGLPGVAAAVDGPAGEASFANPVSLGIDVYGNFYVLDRDASTIRKVAANGDLSTIIGLTGQTGANDGTGQYATMNHPAAFTVSAGGYVYIADTGNELIRQFYPTGNGIVFGPFLVSVAGTAGAAGTTDGVANNARFMSPAGIVVTKDYTLYIADTGENRIRKIGSGDNVIECAGVAATPGAADGPATSAEFNAPTGLAFDAAGDLYVADTNNNVVRRIGTDGSVTTVAGAPGIAGFADGLSVAARFNHPTGLAFDSLGNLYVADSGNHAIRRIAPSTLVTTVIGNGAAGHANGDGLSAQLNDPTGLAFDGTGRLFIADSGNRVIRMAVAGTPAIPPPPPGRHRAVAH
jgi:sugar lactone lactonase YvrE